MRLCCVGVVLHRIHALRHLPLCFSQEAATFAATLQGGRQAAKKQPDINDLFND